MVQQHHAHENRSTKALPLSFRIILVLARGPRASRIRFRHRCRAAVSVSATADSITESAVETTADVAAAGVDAVVGLDAVVGEGDEEDMDDED